MVNFYSKKEEWTDEKRKKKNKIFLSATLGILDSPIPSKHVERL